MRRFEHFVVTRFNVGLWTDPKVDVRGKAIDPEQWMRHRIAVFRGICCRSLAAQEEKRFRWVILLDALTSPRDVRSIVAAAQRTAPVVPVLVDSSRPRIRALQRAVSELVLTTTEYVITTRLDNDDALGRRAIAYIQACFAGQSKQLIVFPRGFRWCGGRLYRAWEDYDGNAFKSLVEQKTGDVLCTVYEHACGSGGWTHVLTLHLEPTWLATVHGFNLFNHIEDEDSVVGTERLSAFGVRASDLRLAAKGATA
jgi:hypothetical protein